LTRFKDLAKQDDAGNINETETKINIDIWLAERNFVESLE
jgi:hypothetical protein